MNAYFLREFYEISKVISQVYPPILSFLFLVVIAELLVRYKFVQDFILPSPSQVFLALITEREVLLPATFSTITSSLGGLVLSFILGGLAAIVLLLSPFLRRAIYPYAVFFQTVPIIAIAPLLVIWFGFGQSTVIASSFIVSVFPILASTLIGLQSTDPQLIELFQLYKASRKDFILKLKIPAALPHVFSGLEIASGLSVVGAIVGEFIGGGGLGGVVDSARTQQRVDLVFAAVLVSALTGFILVRFVHLIRWFTFHGSD